MLCEAAAVVLEENNNTETTEANTTNKSNYNRSSNSSSDCGSDMLKTSSSKSKSSSKKYTPSSTSTSTSSSSSHRRSIESEAKLWKKIVGFCTKNTGYKFVDDSFPPCDKSLYIDYKSKNASCFGGNGQHFSNQQQQRPVVKWLRPEQIRTHPNERNLEWTVLNEPNLNDIKQGLLGNCWLLSGLVVILEQIELLERILVSTEYSPYGCYPIRLCHNGEWKLVLVDDLFPCNALTSRLIYSQAIRKQLWVPLIEKAMAKLNGSYESLVAGQTVEALSALTGYPCESIRLEDDPNLDVSSSGSSSPADATAVAEPLDFDMIWTRLLSMKEAGYVLAASCGRTNVDDDRIFTDRGLLPRHAYSVLNIKEVNGNQLIQLRNPWGRYAWTGDWCESSSKWTPEIRKSLEEILSAKSKSKTRPNNNVNSKTTANTTNKTSGETKKETRTTTTTSVVGVKDEGVFWMSFADFVQYFSSVDICKTRLDWFEKRHSGVFASSSARKIQAFHLIVFETSLLDVELFHKSNKNRRENSHLDLCFVVLDYKTRKFVASSKRSIKKFIQAEHMFEPGEYLIVPVSFNFWAAINSSSDIQNNSTNSDKEKSSSSSSMMYNLVVHGPRPFYLESEFHSIYLQAEAIIELSMNTGQRSQSGMEGVSIYTLAKGYSGLIVTAENLNERAYFHVELDCVKSSNVVSTRPNQALLTIDSVPPRTRQVLILLSQLEPSKSYSVQYSIKYRLSSNPYLNTWPGNEGEFCKNKPRVDYGLHTPQPSSI